VFDRINLFTIVTHTTGGTTSNLSLDFRLHPLPSAAVSAALPRGHVALAFVDVGVGFADRATVVVAVGFLRICGFYMEKLV
jgi:hypothetical protein